ncbi:MAG: Zn-ribbon domain-containing OB-fold protein [Chloroflexota bacterium]|jgi:hypothetical protein
MPEREFNNTSFQTYLGEHKLMGSRCASCDALYVPPRPLCSDCFGETMTWEEMGGHGELRAFTVVHIASSAMIEAGYGRENPHFSGIVKLDEGPSISAQILGADAAHPEQLAIGTPLHAVFIERGEGEEARSFLAFEVESE